VPLVERADASAHTFDVLIVGAGPAGLSCAFTCHDRGLRVLVLDAGKIRPVPGSPDVLAAEIEGRAHDPTEIVAASALGGSSHWWGGRSVPLDPVDLRNWPVSWDEMLPWWHYAAELIGAGAVIERPAPGKFSDLKRFSATTAESWAPDPNLARRWRARIQAPDGPAILLGARVTGFSHEHGKVTGVHALADGAAITAKAAHVVLAGGGLGSLRLMLMAQREDASLFGGADGPLGRGYMGHLTGSIADIVFNDPDDAAAFGHFTANGAYSARRRIRSNDDTVEAEGIGNIVWWLDQPQRDSAAHGSPLMSAKFLAAYGVRLMAGEWGAGDAELIAPHLANVGRAPWSAATGLAETAWILAASRITRQKFRPKAFLSSGGNGWRSVYHSEQRSDPSNRIALSERLDSIGLPKLQIGFRFSREDFDSVVRAHELLDADLRGSGAGSIRWNGEGDLHARVEENAHDGYHQIGGAPMGVGPGAIVDRECRAIGFDNLWVTSGCVMPSGGHANPTLTIMALACRAADRIASLRKAPGRAAGRELVRAAAE
jgi:choline dehydrogenase-like flavoprotein